MWKYKLLMGCLVLLLLIGCQSSELSTPTPFPPTPENISWNASGSSITPVPAVLADVMANPEFYENAYLQVTGQYFRGPLQVCGIDPHPSPAGWALVAGDVRVPAGGFDNEMRQLIPDTLTMTVIGRLTHWRGPVGCGKQAVSREMWYLEVVKMIDPVQLALVTLTPSSGSGDLISDGGIGADLFTPVSGGAELDVPVDGAGVVTLPPVAPPTNTTVPTRAVPVETLAAGFTPVATDDISVLTPNFVGTPVGSGTAVTPNPSNGTSTVTNTPRPGTTATPSTNGSSTPIVIATVSSSVEVMPGNIGELEFRVGELSASKIHEWTMPLGSEDEVIVSVMGEPSMDVTLMIYDSDLIELAKSSSGSVGEAETITFVAPADDNYKIRVSESNRKAGGYILTFGQETYQLLPQGMLAFGSMDQSIIYVDEVHYWFFKGNQGDVIDLEVVSESGTNLLVFLYNSDGDYVEVDEIQDTILPENDWYVLELEEWLADENEYQLTLTKQ